MAVSADPNLAGFFAKMENQYVLVVRETPRFDLDSYAQNYQGQNRVDRLLHIGRSSVVLCVDAFKAAVAAAKTGKDVQRYRDTVDCLRDVAPNDPDAQIDGAWVEKITKENAFRVHKLDGELKGYKNNLVKESVRLTQEELGALYADMGNLESASDMFSRMRADATTPKHVVDTGKQLVDIALQRRDWVAVSTNIHKITGIQGDEEEKAFQTYARTTTGLAYLGQEKYHEAALSFLSADSRNDQAIEHMSPNDVAVYGGLLALATMTRDQLNDQVLENTGFRTFLELEPHIRRAINQFVNGRYSACLETLEAYRADYLLDIYLQKHIPLLYSTIRQKCIVQYLQPFSCVTLENMNEVFASKGNSIEQELINMIREGALSDARIDAIDKVLIKNSVNPRIKMQAAGLQMATNYEKEVIERLRRISIASAGLEIKGPARSKVPDFDSMGGSNEWYDSAQIVE